MKRAWGAWLLIVMLCLSLHAAAEGAANVLLVYVVGSDLESGNGLAVKDLEEIRLHLPQNVTVLVCLGGAERWSNGLSMDAPTVYALDGEGLHEQQRLCDGSMTSAETLGGFLAYAHAHAPSENTALVLWDHGGGPLIGFGLDETADDDRLTLPEMRDAFSASPYQGRNRLRWIGFDACLMGSLETAVLLEPYAEYLIASEEVELPCGWDYSFVSLMGGGLETPALAEQILNRFYRATVDACGGNPELMPSITLAAYDLSESAALVQSLQELFEQAQTTLTFGGYAAMARVRADMEELGRFSCGLTTDLVDLQQLVGVLREVYPKAAYRALQQLDAFVIDCATNNLQYSGLSVYFPYGDKAAYLSLGSSLYREISFSDAYTAFVDRFAGDWLEGTLEETPLLQSVTGEGGAGAALPDGILKNVAFSRYVILERTRDGYIRYLSSDDVETANGVLRFGSEPMLAYLIREDTGERMPIGMTYVKENDTFRFYHVPVLLKRFEAETVYQIADLQVAVDKETMQGIVVGAFPEGDTVYGKQQITLTDWDGMEFWNTVFIPTYDASGQLEPYERWEKSGALTGYGVSANAPICLEAASADAYNADLYVQFSACDYYGNLWNSELIQIRQADQVQSEEAYTCCQWEDPSVPLVLLDCDDLYLELADADLQTTGKLLLTACNRTEKTLALNLNELAVNGWMAGLNTPWIFDVIAPGESVTAEISLEEFPFALQTVSRYESLRFRVTLSVANSYDDACFEGLYDIGMGWPVLREPEARLRRTYAAPFWLEEQLLYEDEFLRIEAEPAGDYSGVDSSRQTTLFLKCWNKTALRVRVQVSEAHINDWMIEATGSAELLPDTWEYLELPVSHEWVSGADDVMGLTLEWFQIDAYLSSTITLDGMKFQYAPFWPAQGAFTSSPITSCAVEDVQLEPYTLLSSSTLSVQLRNLSDRPLMLYPKTISIDGESFSLYSGPHLLLPGKRIRIPLHLPNGEAFDVSPYARPIESIQVDMDVLDAQTNQKLDSFVLLYTNGMLQRE